MTRAEPLPWSHDRRAQRAAETSPSTTWASILASCRRSRRSATRRPSPIQAATIPTLLSGRDVVGLAQTGTGKTAAFALPILSRLDLRQKTAAGAGPRADPRARAAGVRGVREVRRAPAGRARAPRLRRPGVRRPAQRAAPRRAHRGRHARPDHGPPRAGHPRPDRAAVPGARRGRRDAQHGLRRGRRDDPGRHPGRQERRALLGHHAGADPADLQEVPHATRPRSPSRTRRRRRPTSRTAT